MKRRKNKHMDENEKNGHMKKVTKKNILSEFVKKYY